MVPSRTIRSSHHADSGSVRRCRLLVGASDGGVVSRSWVGGRPVSGRRCRVGGTAAGVDLSEVGNRTDLRQVRRMNAIV